MLTKIEEIIDERMPNDFYKCNIKMKLSELIFWITYSRDDIDENIESC